MEMKFFFKGWWHLVAFIDHNIHLYEIVWHQLSYMQLYIWELRDQMPSAWTTMILVQSSTAFGDTQDTMIANHENKYHTDLFFVRNPCRVVNLDRPLQTISS